MLFHVEMTVRLPTDMDPVKAATLKAEEKAMCQRLMNEGTGICGGSPGSMRTSVFSTSRACSSCMTC